MMADDLVERVARAIRDELGLDWPYTGHAQLLDEARAAIEATQVATLETALRTIQSAIPGYLKGEMSEHDFALLVLEAADSAKVNKALEKGK
jgi:hypothetical protein